jgi:hypothetical protein
MTTAHVLDPVADLEQMVERHEGVEPVVTIAEDMALVSFRRGGQLATEVWLRDDRGWQMRGTYCVAAG